MSWDEPGPLAEVPVDSDETLSHYLFRKELREDLSVRREALIPHPYLDLSVTRHRDLTEEEIWECGHGVAAKQKRTLFGRAQFLADDLSHAGLEAKIDDPPRNHAILVPWPDALEEQLAQAERLAIRCKGVRVPK